MSSRNLRQTGSSATSISRFVLLLTLALGGCAPSAPTLAQASPWTMYQHTADHNAIVAGPNVKGGWRFDAGGQINGGLAFDGTYLYADTLAGDLYAIDVRSREVAWQAHVPHSLMSTPLVYDGLVIVGSGSNAMLTPNFSIFGPGSSVMGTPEGDAIYAFDRATGRLRWTFKTRGENMATGAIVRNALVFANGDFHVYALDPATGHLLWKRSLNGIATMASAATDGARVFISICTYRFPYRCETDSLDPTSGKMNWRAPYGNADASPTYADGTVFVSGLLYVRQRWPQLQPARAIVAALDASTGMLKWQYRDDGLSMPSNVGTNERAVAGTYADGRYYQALPGRALILAFDSKSGKVLWRYHPVAPVKMSALYEGGQLYAGGIAGVFYVLDSKTGNALGIHAFRNSFTSSPPIIAGRTIFMSRMNYIDALPVVWLRAVTPWRT